ncbi:MAG: hypothetical protein HRF43_10375 [Phycisphaerae bacterium]|jgi:hypothetical protein
MTPQREQDLDGLLEAYLAGRLTGPELTAFERRLAGEPALRAELEAQRRIDAALRGAFAAPELSGVLARAQVAVAAGRTPASVGRVPFGRRPLVHRLLIEAGVAAVIGLLIGGGYLFWQSRQGDGPRRPALVEQSLGDFYAARAQVDFAPDWECPPDRFYRTFDYRLGQPLLMASAPGVTMKGLAYSNTLSPHTVNVLAKVDGQGVIVYADLAETARPARVCENSGLRLFQRRLGPLILYELTPLDAPRVLDLLYIPSGPPAGSGG